MSQNISIAPFILNVYEQGSSAALPLDALNDETGFYAVFQSYLKTRIQQIYLDDKRKAVLKMDKYESDDSFSIWGRFQKGDYGYQAILENVKTGEIKERGTNECELIPFFFFLKLKKGQKQGILLLQRSGNLNLRGALQRDLQNFLRTEVSKNLKIEIQPLVSPEYLEKILGSQIKELSYIKYMVPTDIADDCGLVDNQEDLGSIHFTIQTKRGRRISIPEWALSLISGKKQASEFITIKNVAFDEVKMKVDVFGKEKTICLSPESQPTMNIDVNPEIALDGHPTIESLFKISQELVPEFSRAIGWKNA